ncbi:alpha-tubulin suppressor-like RCC1 family protein [Nocardioides ginsengisegetis]|uniref:Alpha-tubulin suppressor-like RCC1 family protein n=1 Tax=Nocardioides ginsengisegetis TaxID=661491 RepID=A0A7W3P8A5_9ACTN|nr:alpha-tubulin suppressor-like RCC1 family protein [Nocardioides ginsengisegetis]
MRRRAGQLLALAIGALVSAAMVAAVLHVAGTPEPGRTRDRAVLGAGTAAVVDQCRDILLVGIDGGGEGPTDGSDFGRTVGNFRKAYTRLAVAGDRSVEMARVEFGGADPAALVGAHTPDVALKAVNAKRARAWRNPVPGGVSSMLETLDQAAYSCPDQQVVLVGYAQGASVVHRVLLRLQDRPEGLSRVVGAALVSDPDRRAHSVASHLVGAPAAPVGHPGVLTRLIAPPQPDVPAGTPTYSTWNVCTAGDLVCDPSRTTVRAALKAARSYRFDDGAAAVRGAAKGLWTATTLWPLPRPEIQVVTTRTGQPFSQQLGVTVAPAAAAGVVWGDAQNLPPGMTLDEHGVLSGTPTETGTWNISYVVSGTTPGTTGSTGVVVLTTTPESASVSAGGQSSCETRSDGTVWCWGRNNFGQLGNGSTGYQTRPVQAGHDTDWAQVSTSGASTCAVKSDGTLWCWGLDNWGQLGIGRGKPQLAAVQVGTSTGWASVSTSWFHTCGTRTNGTLWCWGQNSRGELGDGTMKVKGYPTRVGVDKDWQDVTAGGFHTCATRTNGTAWCWGQNIFGQLGNTNLDPQPVPVQVGTDASWYQLSAGWAHTCGVTTDGRASCWGLNNKGQLGDGSRNLSRSPAPVDGSHIWTSISTGDASTCGLDNSGNAYCWGANRYTQLGDGTNQQRSDPTLVSSGSSWVSVESGWMHVCGGLSTGVTACWGNNEAGQVGNGTVVDQAVPQEVQ